MRSGIVLWAATAGDHQCSLGFTARAGDGSRWAVTAGHCGAILPAGDGVCLSAWHSDAINCGTIVTASAPAACPR